MACYRDKFTFFFLLYGIVSQNARNLHLPTSALSLSLVYRNQSEYDLFFCYWQPLTLQSTMVITYTPYFNIKNLGIPPTDCSKEFINFVFHVSYKGIIFHIIYLYQFCILLNTHAYIILYMAFHFCASPLPLYILHKGTGGRYFGTLLWARKKDTSWKIPFTWIRLKMLCFWLLGPVIV
jgi:hypothetical protein